jgi:Tol biopolymer transport system component
MTPSHDAGAPRVRAEPLRPSVDLDNPADEKETEVRRIILIGFGLAAAAAAVIAPAQATFRGANGLLAYQAQVGGHVQLFTVRPDGSEARQLTKFTDSDATNAAWSPDGKTIGFNREWGPNKLQLYTMNADGSGLHALDRRLRGTVGWLPDGKHILTLRNLRWTIVSARGTQPRDAGIPGSGASQCVLADGKRAVFIATLGRADGKAAIFVAQIGGGSGSLKRITPWETLADKIDCSPDGTRVAFSAPGFGGPRSSNLYTIRTDGTGLRQLTHDHGGKLNDGLDSWSPDGKKIAFISNRSGTYEIYTINVDGSSIKQITKGPEAHLAAWGRHP